MAGKKLKKNGFGNGTDDYGFSAMPCGVYHVSVNKFVDIDAVGVWWTDEDGKFVSMDGGGRVYMRSDNTGVFVRDAGASVRCVQGAHRFGK